MLNEKVRKTGGKLNIRIFNTAGLLVYVDNINHTKGIDKYKISNLKLIPGLYLVDVRLDEEKPVGLEKLIILDK